MTQLLEEIIVNKALWIAVLSWFVAQFIKVAIELLKHKKMDIFLFISTGGMPSSHSSFVTALTMSVGFKEGFYSSLFAVSAVLSLVVMYDAAGIRRAAGHQAAVLNMMIEKLNNPNISLDKKLRELLGHTPVEVAAGAILGVFISILFRNYL